MSIPRIILIFGLGCCIFVGTLFMARDAHSQELVLPFGVNQVILSAVKSAIDGAIPPKTKRLSKSAQSLWHIYAKDTIRSIMKDPDSVKFRNIRFFSHLVSGHEMPVTCGEFNAKNAFGGYIGYKHFVYTGPKFPLAIEGSIINFDKYWNALCKIS